MLTEEDERDASEYVLSVLGNDTRRSILRELYRTYGGWGAEQGLAFSELYRRVNAPDAGTFNYHLDQLVGTFVEKTDGRYRASLDHVSTISRILTWSELDHEPRGPVDTDYECDRCSGTLTARYSDQRLTLVCEEGDDPHYGGVFPIPYGAARDRDLAELVPIGLLLWHQEIERLRIGSCPLCYDVVDVDVYVTRGLPGPDPGILPLTDADDVSDEDGVRFAFSCRRCGDGFGWAFRPISSFALHSPEGRAFLGQHDHDPFHVPKVHSLYSPHLDTGFVVSRNPVRLRTTLAVDDDRRVFTFDESATLLEIE